MTRSVRLRCCGKGSDGDTKTDVSDTRLLDATQMPEMLLSVIGTSLNDEESCVRNALMHENAVNLHQTGHTIRWTQHKFLRGLRNL